MAKSQQTKADAIREALKKTDSPTRVARMLSERGVEVSSGYVSAIKAEENLKEIRRRRQVQKNSKPQVQALKEANELMQSAVALVAKSGGGGYALALVETAIRIVDCVRKAESA